MNELISRPIDLKVSGKGQLSCPFPGLRPFNSEESPLFFGREKILKELLDNLHEKRLIVITGKSGSGKTSILNAGLIAEFNKTRSENCTIISFTPGDFPLKSLAYAIASKIQINNRHATEKEIEALLSQSTSGLSEIIKSVVKPGESVLFVIDQFEQICRFDSNNGKENPESFINLLIDAYNNSEIPILIAIALRSEYIEQCSQTFGINQVLNTNSLSLPDLSTDELRDAITLPVISSGAAIESQVVNQIISDCTNVQDKLPKIQFALKEAWSRSFNRNRTEIAIITSDYIDSGAINSLSTIANFCYENLSNEEKKTCEKILKSIISKNKEIYVSSPLIISEIADVSGINVEKIIEVSEKLRLPNCPILLSSSDVILTTTTELQILHECLPYIWNRLSSWIEEESSSILIYKNLAEEAEIFQASRSELLKPPALFKFLDWEKKQQPTIAWAKKYNPAFERTMLFLKRSELEYRKEEEKKLKLIKQKKKRRVAFLVVIVAITLIVLGVIALKLLSLLNKPGTEKVYKRTGNNEQSIKKRNVSASVYTTNQISNSQAYTESQEKIDSNFNSRKAVNEEEQIKKILEKADFLATKSLQITEDKYLKGLLAYYAYSFYNRFGEAEYNSIIFEALSEAVKSLYGDYYNVYKGHTDAVNTLIYYPDKNVFYSASSDGRVAEWSTNDKLKRPKLILSGDSGIQAACISNNGRWLVCASPNMPLQIFDLKDTNIEARLIKEEFSKNAQCLAFLPDNKHFFSSEKDKKIILWDIESGENEIFAEISSGVSAICTDSTDRTLIVGTYDGKILVYELAENESIEIGENGNEPITAISISKDGNYIVTGDKSGNIALWNYLNLNLITVLKAHSARVTDLKFSPTGDVFASSGIDNKVLLWSIDSYSKGPILVENHASPVLSLSFNSDGNTLLIGSENEDRIIAKPVNPAHMADMIKQKMIRNLSWYEWDSLIGKDIAYDKIH